MASMLDCIYRIPSVVKNIIEVRKDTFKELLAKLGTTHIDQIILCGSGTSNTSAVTARRFIELCTGIQTLCILPEELIYNCFVYRKTTLYVFISHSGTSILTCEAARKIHGKALTASLSDEPNSLLVSLTDVWLKQNNGKEEYLMRTIGYNSTVMTLMMMGLEIGYYLGKITEEKYNSYINQALLAANHHTDICDETMKWFDKNHDQFMNSKTFVIYGSDSLWGVALEAALKIMEISKRFIAVGYELDDGMHGPTMGFTNETCVLGLHDGIRQDEKMHQLMMFVKNEKGNGYMIGENTIDDRDLPIHLVGKEFIHLEIAPVIQIFAYRLAIDFGIDLDNAPHPEKKYFVTHRF